MRHGDAGPYTGAADDAGRELTAAGVAALQAAAPLWRSLGLRPDVVLASPLTRARQTADLFAAGVGLAEAPIQDERLAPGAEWDDLAHAIAAHPEAGRVLFVGHEPDLSGAVRLLTGASSIRLRPGGIACVEFPGDPEPGTGELAWLLDPDLYGSAAAGGGQVTRLAAYALCVDDAGRLLLTRLSPGELRPGEWTLPGGGIDFGEAPKAAALRELTEETGLTGEIVSLAGVDSWVRRGPIAAFPGDDFQAIQIIYRIRVTGGTLRDELAGSTDAAGWFTRTELGSLPVVELVESGIRLLDAD